MISSAPGPAGTPRGDRGPRPASDEPRWERWRRRVWGAPGDLALYLVPATGMLGWALVRQDCLSGEEEDRAGRLLDERRRELYVTSHVILRHVLGHHLGCPPEAVTLLGGPTGAPVRAASARTASLTRLPEALCAKSTPAPLFTSAPQDFPRASTELNYSLSRTPGYVAIAVAHRPVGVDVEQLQTPPQADALLALLHPEEIARMRGLGTRRRARAVTATWVRLEALLKGRGVGLALDPAGIVVGGPRRARHPGDWWVTGVRARRAVHLAVAWRTIP